MGKAGKLIVGGVVALILVVGIVLVFVISNLDVIVKRAIENVGTDVAGVPVSVGSVQISLKEGTGTVNGLSLGNPPGFGRGKAFELGSIALKLDVGNTSAELVTVSSVLVDGARVNVVQNASGNNLKAIQKNLASDSPGDAGDSSDDAAGGTKLIIDEFAFRNGQVSLELQGVGERRADIPDFQVTGIGRKSNGATAAEAARQILDPLVRRSITAASGISGIEELGEQAVEKVLKDVPEGAAKGLGDLLKGDKQ